MCLQLCLSFQFLLTMSIKISQGWKLREFLSFFWVCILFLVCKIFISQSVFSDFPPRLLVQLFVTTAMFFPRQHWRLHLSFNIFKEYPVHNCVSALKDFRVRQNWGKPLLSFLPGTHKQVKIDKHNILGTKSVLLSLGPATYTGNTGWVKDSDTPEWGNQARLK